MGIKTFNIDEQVYKVFSAYCKKNGISMSKRVENFLKDEIAKLNGRNVRKAVSEKTEPVKQSLSSGHHSTFSKYC